MKKLLILTGIFTLAVFWSNAQQQGEQKTPDEQVIVNKKYDEQGNLTEYDSTTIHRWSMDTVFHFGLPGDSLAYPWNFSEIDRFMKEFWSDSVFDSPFFPNQPFSLRFLFSPYDQDKEPDHRFGNPWLNDSTFLKNFPLQFDSLFFDFGFEPSQSPFHGVDPGFLDDFEQRLNEHFYRFRDENFAFPGLKNKEYLEEWEQLMQKHQKEMDELRKKWQEKEQPGRKI